MAKIARLNFRLKGDEIKVTVYNRAANGRMAAAGQLVTSRKGLTAALADPENAKRLGLPVGKI